MSLLSTGVYRRCPRRISTTTTWLACYKVCPILALGRRLDMGSISYIISFFKLYTRRVQATCKNEPRLRFLPSGRPVYGTMLECCKGVCEFHAVVSVWPLSLWVNSVPCPSFQAVILFKKPCWSAARATVSLLSTWVCQVLRVFLITFG